jgi:hypothetical protein
MAFKVYPKDVTSEVRQALLNHDWFNSERLKQTDVWYHLGKMYVRIPHHCFRAKVAGVAEPDDWYRITDVEEISVSAFLEDMKSVKKGWWNNG